MVQIAPIGAGHGCIGCSEPDFWDKYAYERPMADANIKAPTGGVEKSVDEFGLGLLLLLVLELLYMQ